MKLKIYASHDGFYFPDRVFTRCRVAYIIDGREGYAPWRPIAEYEALRRGAARVQAMGEIRAWVERR
jgi:hypothetical protein